LKRENIQIIFLIFDIGIITNQDLQVYKYLNSFNKKIFIILNKIDKYSKNLIDKQIKKFLLISEINEDKIILVSGKKKIGIKNIINKIKFS
jgi:GTP-binding protein EngB required for normal cell division